MSRDHNAGQLPDIKTENKSFERVEQFRYLGTNLTNENSIHWEIKRRLKSQNSCYNSVQHLLSSILLSKNIKMKIYRTTIVPVVFVWVWNLVTIKNTWLPLFAHSRNCYTCNHSLERKRRDNFNEIRECFFVEKTILFPCKKCPCWQETNVAYQYTARELTLVVKWNTLRNIHSNASAAAPCSNSLYALQRTFIQNVVELNAIIFSYIIV